MTTSPSTEFFNKLNTEFYPIPFDSYFLIIIDDNGYKFWHEVINLIKKPLKDRGAEIVVHSNGNYDYGCFLVKKATIPQLVYLCQNSIGHTGCYEDSRYFSSKYVDFSELPDCKFSDINCKFKDKNPSYIASLICNQKFDYITYLGCNSNQKFVEFIPTEKTNELLNKQLVLRLDKGGDVKNASGYRYNGIIFNSSDQFYKPVFDSSAKIYAIVDDIRLVDIKDKIDNKWSFICNDKNILSKKRCEFIDYKVFLSDNSKRGVLKGKDLSGAFCTSNRKIFCDGEAYNSYAHMKKGLTFAETFDIIDCNDFWESQDFLRIFKK